MSKNGPYLMLEAEWVNRVCSEESVHDYTVQRVESVDDCARKLQGIIDTAALTNPLISLAKEEGQYVVLTITEIREFVASDYVICRPVVMEELTVYLRKV